MSNIFAGVFAGGFPYESAGGIVSESADGVVSGFAVGFALAD